MLKLKPILLLLLLSLLACGKKVGTNIITIDKFENTWGLEFKSNLIDNETNPEILNASKAVALIEDVTGSTATGFFISEDGLFLTNHHVVSKERCSDTRCNGLKIIRDFREKGEFEVFKSVTLLANDPLLDFALLKINVNHKKVPFLKINFTKTDFSQKQRYKIIGHPAGGALRSSDAYIDHLVGEDFFALRSTAISGNSGSPMMNSDTLEVEALYHAGSWDKGSVTNTGEVKHYGESILLNKIFTYLGLGFDINNSNSRGLEISRKKLTKTPYGFEPRSTEDILKFGNSEESIAGVAENGEELNPILNKILTNLKSEISLNPVAANSSIYDVKYFLESLIVNKMIKGSINDENLFLIKSLLPAGTEDIEFEIINSLKVNNLTNCYVKNVSDQPDVINQLIRYTYYCNSSNTLTGESIINLLSDELALYSEDLQLKYKNTFKGMIERQLLLSGRNLQKDKKINYLKFVELLQKNTNNFFSSMSLEKLKIKIIKSELL